MGIIRGTTPTLTFHVKNENIDLNDIAEVWITFKTKPGIALKEKTYDIDDVTIDTVENNILLNLSQEDTLYFENASLLIQLRVRLNNDLAYASAIMDTQLGQILKDGVI